jgi:TRAP-type C4-dicarboxylate transport system substrate-binding protein
MLMTKLARVFVAALAAALLSGTAATAGAQELRLSTFVPPVHVIYREILVPWAAEVEKATKGQVKVTLYPSM